MGLNRQVSGRSGLQRVLPMVGLREFVSSSSIFNVSPTLFFCPRRVLENGLLPSLLLPAVFRRWHLPHAFFLSFFLFYYFIIIIIYFTFYPMGITIIIVTTCYSQFSSNHHLINNLNSSQLIQHKLLNMHQFLDINRHEQAKQVNVNI